MKCSIPLIVLAATLASTRVAGAQAQPRDALVMCLAADANHEAIWPTESFPVSGKQMACVFRLGADESFAKLTSKWIAVDVGDVAPANTLIAEGDLDLKGQKAGRLRYSQPGPLPVGKYRLDVLGDGKPWKSVEFEVAADPKPLRFAKPEELLPLTDGKTWTYELVQEAGPGAKISAEGEKLDADGKLRATVTLTVGKVDDLGAPVTVKRNGKTMTQEWWMLGRGGLLVTQRKAGSELTRLDPPQPLIPESRDTYVSWTYAPKDRSFSQTGQSWAPLPIKGPGGEKPGFLTVLEQSTPVGKVTVERHFLPGVGMVKEVMTSTIGPKLLSRQTLTLVAKEPDAEKRRSGRPAEGAR